jgi:hypothetical protein
MASQVVTKQVNVVCGQETAQGTLEVTEFDSASRARRAGRRGAVCVLAIGVSACIPGAHFVLVPLLLVLSPILIFRAYRVSSAITNMSCACAQCGGALSSVSTTERYPLYETCVACHRENRICLT